MGLDRAETMHDFGIYDLGGLLAAGWVFVKILGPVGAALARRIEGRVPPPADDPAVDRLRDELGELYERVDFLERTLAVRPPQGELPKSRTPV